MTTLEFEQNLPLRWMHGTFHQIKTDWHYMVHFGDEDTVHSLLTDKLFLDGDDVRTENPTPFIYTITLTGGLNILRTTDFLSPEPAVILSKLVALKAIPDLNYSNCVPVQRSLYESDKAATDKSEKRQLRARYLANYLKDNFKIDGFIYRNEMEGFDVHNDGGTDSIMILSPENYRVSEPVKTVTPRSLAEYYMRHFHGHNIFKYQRIDINKIQALLK